MCACAEDFPKERLRSPLRMRGAVRSTAQSAAQSSIPFLATPPRCPGLYRSRPSHGPFLAMDHGPFRAAWVQAMDHTGPHQAMDHWRRGVRSSYRSFWLGSKAMDRSIGYYATPSEPWTMDLSRTHT